MGNSATFQKSQKVVVIVGLSYAGLSVLEGIWDNFQVIAIDKNNYFEHIPAAVKAPVDRNLSDEILLSYQNMVQAYNNKFQFIQGELVNVNTNDSIDIRDS